MKFYSTYLFFRQKLILRMIFSTNPCFYRINHYLVGIDKNVCNLLQQAMVHNLIVFPDMMGTMCNKYFVLNIYILRDVSGLHSSSFCRTYAVRWKYYMWSIWLIFIFAYFLFLLFCTFWGHSQKIRVYMATYTFWKLKEKMYTKHKTKIHRYALLSKN